MSDLHRIPESYIPVSPRQPTFPRRSGYPRVDEVESRGWGRRAPQSPSSSSFGAPQGNNKIYTYDVVFPIGEAKINNHSQTPIPYKITKDISQPQFDKPTASYTTHPPTASQNYRPRDKVPTECEKFAKIRGILLHDGDRIGIIVSWGIFPTESENVGGLRI